MKYAVTILLALMLSGPSHALAESKYSIFLEKIREIEFKDTYVIDTLEFMREKGTEIVTIQVLLTESKGVRRLAREKKWK